MTAPTILVTGGTGFLGAYIIRELVQRDYRVRAIRRETSRLPTFIPADTWEKVEWVEADVLDVVALQEALAGIDTVVHAAAIVSFDPSNRKKMQQVNVQGTANLVNLSLEAGVRRFVHISSVAALGRTASGEKVDETKVFAESALNTAYAISKYQGELEVWRGFAEGLEGVILNPSTILGYGDWNSSSCALFRQSYDAFPWYTNGVNGFVGVEDVTRAAVDLLETRVSMERFIVNADNWSFRQLMTGIAENFGKRPPRREATPLMGQIAWRWEKLRAFFTGKKPLLTRETARVARSKTYFSAKKLEDALPAFRFTPLNEVIRNSCRRYLAELSR